MAQEDSRARGENERLRADGESRLAEAEENHRGGAGQPERRARPGDGVGGGGAAGRAGAHRRRASRRGGRVAAPHRRGAGGGERAAVDRARQVRKEHEKAIAAAREEQAVQLASERQAYEALTEQKERDHRNEILAMRRRQEEELAGAEERRQRDIAEQEARRVGRAGGGGDAPPQRAAGARRGAARARHRHRAPAPDREDRADREAPRRIRPGAGRAARAEGELAARVQEIEQAYRRLSGLEADLDAARVELGNRDVRLAQTRDRIAELEAKVADYEDQIVRAFQRIRADDKTTEKTRRALAVALALLDERVERAGARRRARRRTSPSSRPNGRRRVLSAWLVGARRLSSSWRSRCRPAAPAGSVVEPGATFDGWESLWLRGGGAEVVVVPAIGRVMQLRLLRRRSATRPFWQHPAIGPGMAADENGWINFGGDKAWPAPQSAWAAMVGKGWPPPRTFDARRAHGDGRRRAGDRDAVAGRSGLRPARAAADLAGRDDAGAVDRDHVREGAGAAGARRRLDDHAAGVAVADVRVPPGAVRRSRAGIAG